MKTPFVNNRFLINTRCNAKTACLASLLSFCSFWTTVKAETYTVTVDAVASQAFPQFGLTPLLYPYASASFLIDYSLGYNFSYPSCCNAIGYSVSNLKVTINGLDQLNWVPGMHDEPFSFSHFDLHGKEFFMGSQGGFWLSLNSALHPLAQMDFGEMYISGGGLNFVPYDQFTARDDSGTTYRGYSSFSWTQNQPVPEPGQSVIMVAGLAFFITLLRRRRSANSNL